MQFASTGRVEANTDERINEEIRRRTEQNIAYCIEHPEEIDRRLEELDEEWDIERTLEANASTLSLLGLTLGIVRGRQWLLLPLTVNSFLLQHAIQGWCPPVPVLRRLGFRTAREIDTERFALKIIRGDLKPVLEEGEQVRSRQVMETVG